MLNFKIKSWIWPAAAGLACGVLGWTIGQSSGSTPESGSTVASTGSAPAWRAAVENSPVIDVAQDGNVTLRVDRQPLKWVLAEIGRQTGVVVADAASAHLEPVAQACVVQPTPKRAEEVANRVMRGAEPERYEELLEAQNGGELTPEMLKTLYETDASPRVRLLAFELALEGTEGDAAGRRTELEAAQRLPDAAISQEATRRLELLAREERDRSDGQQFSQQR